MQKDSAGYVGFIFKDGRIKSIVKDSSAARNGLLTDHQLIEVDGQNVVGIKVRNIQDIPILNLWGHYNRPVHCSIMSYKNEFSNNNNKIHSRSYPYGERTKLILSFIFNLQCP